MRGTRAGVRLRVSVVARESLSLESHVPDGWESGRICQFGELVYPLGYRGFGLQSAFPPFCASQRPSNYLDCAS